MSPRTAAPVAPRTLPAGDFPTPRGHHVTVVQHQDANRATHDRYIVSCEVCGPLATYEAQNYAGDYETEAGRAAAALVDARLHARAHARTCPGPKPRPRRIAGCSCNCHETGTTR